MSLWAPAAAVKQNTNGVGGAGSDVGVKYSRAEPNVWIPITSNEHYPIGLQRWIRCTNEPCNQVHIYAMHAAVHAPCGTSW